MQIVLKQTFRISKVCIFKIVKGVIMRDLVDLHNLRDTIFHMKANVLQNFHICISIPLRKQNFQGIVFI